MKFIILSILVVILILSIVSIESVQSSDSIIFQIPSFNSIYEEVHQYENIRIILSCIVILLILFLFILILKRRRNINYLAKYKKRKV